MSLVPVISPGRRWDDFCNILTSGDVCEPTVYVLVKFGYI